MSATARSSSCGGDDLIGHRKPEQWRKKEILRGGRKSSKWDGGAGETTHGGCKEAQRYPHPIQRLVWGLRSYMKVV